MSTAVNDLTELYDAIGTVVVTWGFVEFGLDASIMAARALPGGHQAIRVLPIGLKQKVKALQDAFKTMPVLKPLRSQAVSALATVLNVKDRRHDLIHSSLRSPKAKNKIYKYYSLSIENGKYEEREWTFDLKKFPSLRQKLEAAVSDSMWLAGAVLALHPTPAKP